MAEDERKYEILPGVKLPDYKTLKEASSNFDDTGVEDINIRSVGYITDEKGVPDRATLEEIKRLQELGDEVAESEQRATEESRKKMQAIMQNAVTKSASLDDLKQTAIRQASGEKLAEIEKRNQEEEARIAAEEEKKRMREERRAMQRKQLEDARARSAAAAEAASVDEEGASTDAGTEDSAVEPITAVVAEGADLGIVSAENTADEPVCLEGDVLIDDSIAKDDPVDTTPDTEPDTLSGEVEESSDEAVVELKPAVVEPEIDIDATGVISTDEETFEDFGEFLDDDNKK